MANMKKNFKFIFIFLWGISLFSCKDDDHEITPRIILMPYNRILYYLRQRQAKIRFY